MVIGTVLLRPLRRWASRRRLWPPSPLGAAAPLCGVGWRLAQPLPAGLRSRQDLYTWRSPAEARGSRRKAVEWGRETALPILPLHRRV